MVNIEAVRSFNRCKGSATEAIAILEKHPELLENPDSATSLIFGAARSGSVQTIVDLLRRGAPVNAVESGLLPHRPIVFAVMGNRVEAVRVFVDYGSEINWGWEVRDDATGRVISGSPVCAIPLQHAVVEGNFEIIKILVEAGSLLNVLDNTKQTILDHAMVHYGADVIEYLRAKGAKRAHEIEL